MGRFAVLKSRVELAPDAKVVKSADYAELAEASRIVAAAQELATRIEAESRAACEAEKKRGYEEGFAQGKMEIAEQMLSSASRGVEYLEHMEKSVVDVVMKSLTAVLGELNEKELVCRVVRKALQQVRDQKKVTVRVSIEDAEAVQSRLQEITRDYTAIGLVEVVADHRLGPKQCILETEMGVIDASLDKQLEIIEKSFRQRFDEART